uniref:Uncharacterized protein n=1 Tax=Siphoviridae sp. ct4Ap70 TaxID=2825328 RepID=A0A8S5NY01_9CAUD|nr:MAG TPA: hypothetical protein [Siphoviridae sp. ct4Ap70]
MNDCTPYPVTLLFYYCCRYGEIGEMMNGRNLQN